MTLSYLLGAPSTPGPRRGADPRPRVRSGGFTLLELVLVLMVVGVLVGIAVPRIQASRARADGAVQQLAYALNAAQRLAVLRQHDMVVTFHIQEARLTFHQDEDNDGTVDDGEQLRELALESGVEFGQGSVEALPVGEGPVSFRAVEEGVEAVLAFHRNGSASESGAVYLRPVDEGPTAATEGVRAVRVERATGEVRCYSHRTGSWEATC